MRRIFRLPADRDKRADFLLWLSLILAVCAGVAEIHQRRTAVAKPDRREMDMKYLANAAEQLERIAWNLPKPNQHSETLVRIARSLQLEAKGISAK